MMANEPERVGLMIIRIWLEGDSQPRARIIATPDILDGAPTTRMVSSADEVCSAVLEWLRAFHGD
jgi:hypothetical protein